MYKHVIIVSVYIPMVLPEVELKQPTDDDFKAGCCFLTGQNSDLKGSSSLSGQVQILKDV